MAIYHFDAKVITRGVGRSVVAAAAYASCSQIYNDYDGVQHNYTRKKGCVYSEILLPPNAPQEWQDRETLWNAVEAAEKSKDSQLARELIAALPVELELDDWIEILHTFISENCVSKGMCADFSIHDTDGHNPHAHILLTMRPLDEKGKWQAKTQKEYLCKRGDEERGFTADEFKAAQSDDWEKQYQYFVGKKKIYMPPSEAEKYNYERASKYPKSTKFGRQNPICAEWNSDEQILRWRKSWEDVVNAALENNNRDERIDCRSFKERGIDEQPTIHEGVTARIMEKRGFVSERCELNRQIKADNRLLRELKAEVKRLTELIKGGVKFIANTLESLRNKIIFGAYELTHNKSLSTELKNENAIIDVTLKQYKGAVKQIAVKSEKLKSLNSEKKNLSPIHFLRHNELSEQIEKLQTEIDEQKNIKAALLDRIGCKSEKDIPRYEAVRTKNDKRLKNISAQNSELLKQKSVDKTEFLEICDGIALENEEAVQNERYNIREEYRRKLTQQLRDKHGNSYNYAAHKDAEREVKRELQERPLSLQRKLQQNKQHSAKQEHNQKRRKREQER